MHHTQELTQLFQATLLTEPELSNLAKAIGQQILVMESSCLLSPVLGLQGYATTLCFKKKKKVWALGVELSFLCLQASTLPNELSPQPARIGYNIFKNKQTKTKRKTNKIQTKQLIVTGRHQNIMLIKDEFPRSLVTRSCLNCFGEQF